MILIVTLILFANYSEQINFFTKSQFQMKNVKYSEIEKRPAEGNRTFPEFDEHIRTRVFSKSFSNF